MKVQIHPFVWIQLIILLTSGCREVVQSDFPEMEPVPVINSILVAGECIHVHISQATSINQDSITWLNDAKVDFFEDDMYIETLNYTKKGLYKGEAVVKENKTYRFEIEIPGMGFFTGSTHVPVAEKIRDFELTAQANKHEEGYTYPSMEILFTNTPGEKKYFDAKIILQQDSYIFEGQVMEHTDPVLLNEGFPLFVFSNEIIDDTLSTVTFNFFTGGLSGSIGGTLKTDLYPMIVELRTVDESYYEYTRQLYLYNTGRYPEFTFSGATAYPLYTNIENAYGVFASYAVNSTDTIYPSNQ